MPRLKPQPVFNQSASGLGAKTSTSNRRHRVPEHCHAPQRHRRRATLTSFRLSDLSCRVSPAPAVVGSRPLWAALVSKPALLAPCSPRHRKLSAPDGPLTAYMEPPPHRPKAKPRARCPEQASHGASCAERKALRAASCSNPARGASDIHRTTHPSAGRPSSRQRSRLQRHACS